MTVTLATSGAVKLKAGANRPTDDTVITATQYDTLINESESYVNSLTGVNWIDIYASLNVDAKYILEDAVSSHAALSVINYDMSGYTSRTEAQTMLNVNYARFKDAVDALKEKKVSDWIQGA